MMCSQPARRWPPAPRPCAMRAWSRCAPPLWPARSRRGRASRLCYNNRRPARAATIGGTTMFESKEQVREAQERWEQQTLFPALERAPERDVRFMTTSGAPVERLYTPRDLEGNDYLRDIAHPGEYPYTRG